MAAAKGARSAIPPTIECVENIDNQSGIDNSLPGW